MPDYQELRAIEARDPDGGEREPTEADYAAHQAWAVALFGQATWDRYEAGGWASMGEPSGGEYYTDEEGY